MLKTSISLVTVCGALVSFVQITSVPTLTFSVAGTKAYVSPCAAIFTWAMATGVGDGEGVGVVRAVGVGPA